MRAVLSIITLITLALLGAGCSPNRSADSSGRLGVVAAFYPIQAAAQAVGGEHVHVTNLTAPGVEPHDLELTPDAVEEIQSADLVLYFGGGFQPAVEDAIPGASGEAVDLLAGLPTVAPPAGQSEGTSVDPHVWLDPELYGELVGEVDTALTKLAPADASTFHANAAALEDDLSSLDRDYAAGLAHCARDVIVTNHAAFGYLAAHYGLTQEAISGLAPDAEPSAARLAQLRTLVEREGVTTIFTEELVPPDVAETLANEAGVQTRVLATIEGLTAEEQAAGDTYDSLMRQNLATLEAALGCS